MEFIIDELFEVYRKKTEFPFGKPNKQELLREFELYETIMEELSKEVKDTFREYAELCCLRSSEEIKQSYINGFKTAVQLFLETMKEN